jgi:hypothetical protein
MLRLRLLPKAEVKEGEKKMQTNVAAREIKIDLLKNAVVPTTSNDRLTGR